MEKQEFMTLLQQFPVVRDQTYCSDEWIEQHNRKIITLNDEDHCQDEEEKFYDVPETTTNPKDFKQLLQEYLAENDLVDNPKEATEAFQRSYFSMFTSLNLEDMNDIAKLINDYRSNNS
ncbi:hypothetical protein WA158_006084 [Blastocystis sp. Blastoise]